MSYGGNEYASYGGGGGGGGFYTGSQAGGGGSQNTPSSEAKSRGSNTLRPVTIKQLLEATQPVADAPFRIDDVETSHITFVARVRSVAEQATNITYVVDDGTGTLDVKQWVDADTGSGSGAAEAQRLNGRYVRVLGQLKSFSNKKHVGSHKIRAVENFNEVLYHLLEVTATHLHLTRGPPEQFAPGGVAAAGAGVGGRDTTMGGMGGAAGAGAGAGAGGMLPESASSNARLVYSTIRAASDSDSSEGVHFNVIKMRTQMSIDAVTKAVEELLSLGTVYTTLDDYHVAPMDF